MNIIVAPRTHNGGLPTSITSIRTWISDRIEVMADHYAAAAQYEQLSHLSDAELRRRGLSRATLARGLLKSHHRPVAE